jgi:hypothetical protein
MSCSGLTNPPAGDSEIEPLLEDLLWSLITRDISQLDSDLKSLHTEIKTPLGEKVRGRGQADTSRTIEKEREGEKKAMILWGSVSYVFNIITVIELTVSNPT